MTAREKIAAARQMPPSRALKGAFRLLGKQIRERSAALKDNLVQSRNGPSSQRIGGFLGRIPSKILIAQSSSVQALGEHALSHRFDLLGSGWVKVEYGMHCAGFLSNKYGPAHAVEPDAEGAWLAAVVPRPALPAARRTWSLISPDYVPIDWQIDFRSGYRWDSKRPSKSCRVAPAPGADIKVPWELARGQHLVHLAWGYALAVEGAAPRMHGEKCLQEFQNQVLDFIATNPPRFGVNWTTSMDVAIRLVNWLVARDIFVAYGATLDSGFEAELSGSIADHLGHILSHLEWDSHLRGNHYLANVVGVLFGAAYLPASPETDGCIAWATRQLVDETAIQFSLEGTNFEGSTSYHRLSSEMVAYATAIAIRVSGRDRSEKLPRTYPRTNRKTRSQSEKNSSWFDDGHWNRLAGMARFIAAVAGPDGRSPQFGDTDNGRLMKIQPVFMAGTKADVRNQFLDFEHVAGDGPYLMEDHLDHRATLDAISTLLGATPTGLEGEVMRALSGGYSRPAKPVTAPAALSGLPNHTGSSVRKFRCSTEGLKFHAFPLFGLYVWKNSETYLAVRCGSVGQKGRGGHAHNDQLAIELWTEGRPRIVDPGTFVYTSDASARNRYRSVWAHDTPWNGPAEPESLEAGLFALPASETPHCLHADSTGFHGSYRDTERIIRINSDGIQIEDTPGRVEPPKLETSPGYGLRTRFTAAPG